VLHLPAQAPLFCQPGIKLLDPRINVNVVAARSMFNNRALPFWFHPTVIDSAASAVI
jgi:hypothetical protein